MRELNEKEMEMVAGGDGFALGGGRYISTTRMITGGLGVVGAVDVGYRAGFAIGTGIEAATGGSISRALGGFAYERS